MPEELLILTRMETYKTLPWAGGLEDQPEWLMQCLDVCLSVRDEVRLVKEKIAAHGNSKPSRS